MNATLRHLTVLAGYGRGRGYLELRWRAARGMRSEHCPISELAAAVQLAGGAPIRVGQGRCSLAVPASRLAPCAIGRGGMSSRG